MCGIRAALLSKSIQWLSVLTVCVCVCVSVIAKECSWLFRGLIMKNWLSVNRILSLILQTSTVRHQHTHTHISHPSACLPSLLTCAVNVLHKCLLCLKRLQSSTHRLSLSFSASLLPTDKHLKKLYFEIKLWITSNSCTLQIPHNLGTCSVQNID